MSNFMSQFQNAATDGHGYEDAQPIPANTEVICMIEEIVWKSFKNDRVTPPADDEFINVRYRVMGGDYDNRVIFQRLYVLGMVDKNESVNSDMIQNSGLMLAAMDHLLNGGKICQLSHDPEDADLLALTNKKIKVTVGIKSRKNQYGETVRDNTIRRLEAATPATSSSSSSSRTANTPAPTERVRRQRAPR